MSRTSAGPYSMWAEACALLERADRLQREFFRPLPAREPTWEPPVDLFESHGVLLIIAALPGVRAPHVRLAFDGADLIISGERGLPAESEGLELRRLEIPFGRFERRIALPPGRFTIDQRRLADGCLTVVLRRVTP